MKNIPCDVELWKHNREVNGPNNILMAMISHPNCCLPGSRYLSFQKSLKKAWEKCDNPFFVCWCLDFMVDQRLEPVTCEGEDNAGKSLERFYMRPWRVKLFKDFIQYELGLWKPLLPLAFKLLGIPGVCLYLYWLTTGYADDRKNGWWWNYTASLIKGIRRRWIFLEVDEQMELD